ncbi:MAG: leucyl/phenylalanyl-tRNA--protein transferase [Acidimicrobiales bacterium]
MGVGADLEPGTVLAAYRNGLFPMPVEDGLMAWWSPQPRAVLPLDGLRVSRSLRKSCARFEVRVDTAFSAVVAACADSDRPGRWITEDIAAAYVRLHQLGWAHSFEAWSLDGGELAGGLYGIATGGLFAGESMFHRRSDASKVALVALVDLLGGPAGAGEGRLLDVQWRTDHLASLGVVELDRATYRERLARALRLPLPPAFA